MHLLHIFSPDSDYFPSFRNIKTLKGGPPCAETPELQDILRKALWAWPYKPGNLENLTLSLFDVFDTCFKTNCMENDELVPQLCALAEKNNFEPWNSYRTPLAVLLINEKWTYIPKKSLMRLDKTIDKTDF